MDGSLSTRSLDEVPHEEPLPIHPSVGTWISLFPGESTSPSRNDTDGFGEHSPALLSGFSRSGATQGPIRLATRGGRIPIVVLSSGQAVQCLRNYYCHPVEPGKLDVAAIHEWFRHLDIPPIRLAARVTRLCLRLAPSPHAGTQPALGPLCYTRRPLKRGESSTSTSTGPFSTQREPETSEAGRRSPRLARRCRNPMAPPVRPSPNLLRG